MPLLASLALRFCCWSRRATAVLAFAACAVGPAAAQAPYDVSDPFYQEETARRAFYDGFAFSAEAAYRPRGLLSQAEADGPNPLAFAFRLDYALLEQVDVSALFNVNGGLLTQANGPLRLSWIVLKPYWHNEHTDYAVRIAVDPASEGGLGFRRTDVAFVSSSSLSPLLSSDFAIGLRRVRVGYERLQLDEAADTTFGGDPAGELADELASGVDSDPDLVRTRSIGREIHVMWGHSLHLDPAGSNINLTLLGEAMEYDVVQTRPFEPALEGPEGPVAAEDEEERRRYRGGVGWLRAGIEWARPSYILSPFASIPFITWVDEGSEGQTWGPRLTQARFGVRVTLR